METDESILLLFQPQLSVATRHSQSSTYFHDLSKHRFSQFQKDFVARELCNESLLILREGKSPLTAALLSRRHNLKEETIRAWKAKYLNPAKALRAKVGRPRKLDDVSRAKLVKKLKERRAEQKAVQKTEFNQMVKEEVAETKKEHGKKMNQYLRWAVCRKSQSKD